MGNKSLKMKNEDGDVLEAETHHGLFLRIMIEVADVERGHGYIARTSFMPTKAQAASLGRMLIEWSVS